MVGRGTGFSQHKLRNLRCVMRGSSTNRGHIDPACVSCARIKPSGRRSKPKQTQTQKVSLTIRGKPDRETETERESEQASKIHSRCYLIFWFLAVAAVLERELRFQLVPIELLLA